MAALNKECFEKGCVCANCKISCSKCSASNPPVSCIKGGVVLECASKERLPYVEYALKYSWASGIVKEGRYEKVS